VEDAAIGLEVAGEVGEGGALPAITPVGEDVAVDRREDEEEDKGEEKGEADSGEVRGGAGQKVGSTADCPYS